MPTETHANDTGSALPQLPLRVVRALIQLTAAAPLFYLSFMLFKTWSAPLSVNAEVWVPFGGVILFIEFFLIHSGVFMAVAASKVGRWYWRALILLGLALFYSGIVAAMALGFGSVEALEVFGLVLLGRFLALVTSAKDTAGGLLARSGCAAVLFLLLIFLAVMLPWPQLGLTAEVLAEHYEGDSGSAEPHVFVAAAMAYFALMGLFEVGVALQTLRGNRLVLGTVS